jgi:hypothetical protein
MKFNFHFGKKIKSAKDYAFIGIVLFSLVAFLSSIFKIDEKNIWILIDLIQKELTKRKIIDDSINDYIIKTPELLDHRVKREVDSAIAEYERWESSLPPRMTNKTILKGLESPRFSEQERMIVKDGIYYECPGGVMGIRAVWVDSDPECQ